MRPLALGKFDWIKEEQKDVFLFYLTAEVLLMILKFVWPSVVKHLEDLECFIFIHG